MLSLGVAALAVIFVSTWLWRSSRDDTTPAPSAGRATCAFAEGDALTYRVELKGTTHVQPRSDNLMSGLTGKKLRETATALVQFRVVKSQGAHAELAYLASISALSSQVDAEPSQEKKLKGLPGVIRIDKRCRVLAVAHRKEADSDAIRLFRPLLSALGFDLTDERVYERDETDDVGPSRVRYGRKDGDTLIRRVLSYHPASRTTKIAILKGVGEIRLGQGPWFKEQRRDLHLRFMDKGRHLADGKFSLHAKRVGGPELGARGAVQGADDVDLSWVTPKAPVENTQPPSTKWPGLKGMSTAQAWRELQRLQGGKIAPRSEAVDFLAAWIKANPGRARELVDALAGKKFSDADLLLLVAGLGQFSGPEGRDALVYMHGLKKLKAPARAAAAMGLAQLVAPDSSVVETLARSARRTEDADKGLVGNASTLALGTLAKKQQKDQPALAEAAEAVLHERLQSDDSDVQREALLAIGNSSGDHFTEQVVPFTSHENPDLRAAAAAALRFSADGTKVYGPWLAKEADAGVLLALGKAIRTQLIHGHTMDKTTQGVLAAAVEEATELRVKAALLSALGQAARTDPSAKAALIHAFAKERDAKNQALYGAYATARELMPDSP